MGLLKNNKNIKFVLKYAKPHMFYIIVLFLCRLLTIAIDTSYPFIFGKLVDEVFYGKNMKVFLSIVIIYAVMYLISESIYFALNMAWARLMTRFLFDIRRDMFMDRLS